MRPIFIGGCPRSGTSMLAFLLGRHPRILAILEPKGVYELFGEMLWKRKLPFWLFRYLFSRWVPRRMSYSVSKQEAAQNLDILGLLASSRLSAELACLKGLEGPQLLATFRHLAHTIFDAVTVASGKTRWCVKAPTYIYENVDLMHSIHPDMQFIHIVRDGRDVVASIMQQPWSRRRAANRFAYALNLWMSIEGGDSRASRLPPGSLFRIRLEDLLRNEDSVRALCSFLGETYDPSLHEYFVKRVKKAEGHEGRWKRDLTPHQIAEIERVGGHLLKRHGYS